VFARAKSAPSIEGANARAVASTTLLNLNLLLNALILGLDGRPLPRELLVLFYQIKFCSSMFLWKNLLEN
jgi:hypothetical protein